MLRRQLEMIARQFDGLSPDEAARRTGVDAHLDKRPHSLSGGELRRAALAAVLVRHVTWCVSGTTYELGAPEAAAENERFRREYLGASFALG